MFAYNVHVSIIRGHLSIKLLNKTTELLHRYQHRYDKIGGSLLFLNTSNRRHSTKLNHRIADEIQITISVRASELNSL